MTSGNAQDGTTYTLETNAPTSTGLINTAKTTSDSTTTLEKGEDQNQKSQQKRFSFYDAREVGGIDFGSSSENVPLQEEKPNPNRFNFYDPSLLAGKYENEPNKQFSFQLPIQREDDKQHPSGEKKAQNTESDLCPPVSRIEDGIRTTNGEHQEQVHYENTPSNSADTNNDAVEILKSLQETEDQRKKILQPSASPLLEPALILPSPYGKVNSARLSDTSRGTTPEQSSFTGVDIAASTGATAIVQNPTNANSSNGTIDSLHNQTNNNPYEDSIRAALTLLRKHKPTPSYSSINSTAGAHQVNDYDYEIKNLHRDRTPKGQDSLLHHRSYDEEDNGLGDEREIKALDDVVQEAKLKSKQHKEVIAKYANKLEEFKSTLPPEQQLQLQLSSSYTQSYDEGDGGNDKSESYHVTQREERDNESASQQPPHPVNHHIKPSFTEDSTGLVSELSQYSNSYYPQRLQQKQLPHQQQVIIEEEVQKGVEKVLVAILEASKNKNTTGVGGSGDSSCSGSNGNRAIDSASTKSGDANEALLQVLHELLPSRRSMGTASIISQEDGKMATSTSTREYPASLMSQESSTNNQSRKSSVVDELLAEGDEDDSLTDYLKGNRVSLGLDQSQTLMSNVYPAIQVRHPTSCNSNVNAARYWAAGDEKKMTEDRGFSDQRGKLDLDSDPAVLSVIHQSREGNILAVKAITDIRGDDGDVVDNSIYESETSGEDESASRSSDSGDEGEDLDTTYEDDDERYEGDESENRHHVGVLGPLSREAGGTTGVVLDVESDESPTTAQETGHEGYFSSVVNYVSSALTPEDERRILDNKRKEEILASYDVVGITTNIKDEEATELMRTLCSHLLPFGVDRNSVREESIPLWDETNPNEPGYRIIRLSRSQLRRVECAFDAMITRLKHNSFSDVEGQFDASFMKELEEAERLLDDNEKRNDANTGGGSAKSDVPANVQPSPLTVPNEDYCATVTPHLEFPGVKSAGKGEMGDLEFFQLPIIYKSHVTGFEPTKDITLEPGNIIAGQYLVESELGSAAFSTAYKCVDLSSGDDDGHEEVCLKVIKNTKDFFDQSLDEIKILELLRQTGQCDENFILRVKTFFYYREHLIIVTELLRQNLFEFGKFILDNDEEPYFTLPRLAFITRQCLIALRFVHSLGLVHSDVKPENILLGSYSRAQIKLIDFGSSCYLTDRQSSYIQSRSYRAPEVVLGLPYNGKIDVWSLGCVVAEMYTGDVTFQNDSIVSMLSRIEALRGSFPRHMIAQGRQSGRFFTKSGLLYEVVGDSDEDELASKYRNPPAPDDDEPESDTETAVEYDVFQPKITRLSSRLGFDADLMDDYGESNSPEERHIEQMFTDFVARLLTIDPDGRPSAEEALSHPYMIYAASLTDTDIKYPSS